MPTYKSIQSSIEYPSSLCYQHISLGSDIVSFTASSLLDLSAVVSLVPGESCPVCVVLAATTALERLLT